jgi:hypothetical protein
MSKLLAVMGIIGAAFTIVAAGCGGGGGDAETTSAPLLSKNEFITQANKQCKRERDEISKRYFSYVEKHPAAGESTPEERFVESVDVVLLPALEGRISALNAIGRPREGQEELDAYLGAMQTGIDEAKGAPPTTFEGFEKIFGGANSLASEFGLTECAG